jgi:plasmid replication initiation protein
MDNYKMVDLPEEQTLIKRNNILNMVILDNKTNIIKADTLIIYNFLYLSFQYNREHIEETKDYELIFSHHKIKRELGVTNNNYIDTIKKSLSLLRNTEFSIKNFKVGRRIIKEHTTGLISSFSDYIDENTKEKMFAISIDKTLFNEMMKIGPEHTKLNLKNIKTLSSSNQIRLYEYVKSRTNMKNMPTMSINDLNNLFMTNLKYLGKLEEIIKRSIKKINEKTDIKISYSKDKRNKTITFKIDKVKKTLEEEKKQQFATAKTIEEDTIIKNSLKSQIEKEIENLKKEIKKETKYLKELELKQEQNPNDPYFPVREEDIKDRKELIANYENQIKTLNS